MIPHDVLAKAPDDTGCRAACLEHCLRQLIKTIDDAHLSSSWGQDVMRLLDAREYAENTLAHVYGTKEGTA